MDEREDIISKVRDFQALVRRSGFPMQILAVWLFGSFAKGNPHEDSDIDVAIIVKQWEGDYFEIMPQIWKLRREVDFRIEPHVIVSDQDYAGMLEEIQRTGIEIQNL